MRAHARSFQWVILNQEFVLMNLKVCEQRGLLPLLFPDQSEGSTFPTYEAPSIMQAISNDADGRISISFSI